MRVPQAGDTFLLDKVYVGDRLCLVASGATLAPSQVSCSPAAGSAGKSRGEDRPPPAPEQRTGSQDAAAAAAGRLRPITGGRALGPAPAARYPIVESGALAYSASLTSFIPDIPILRAPVGIARRLATTSPKCPLEAGLQSPGMNAARIPIQRSGRCRCTAVLYPQTEPVYVFLRS